MLSLAPSVRAQSTGSGTLTINPGGISDDCDPEGTGFMDFDSPHNWDWYQDDTVHINISPGFMICTEGVNLNDKCDDNGDCSTTSGQCQSNNDGDCTQSAGTCSTGNIGASCTTNSNCNIAGTCSGTAPNKTCTAGNIGASCSNDGQCAISGTCSLPPKTCTAGADIGALCDNDNDCEDTSSCADNAPANAGADCTKTGDDFCNIQGTCASALECSGDTNVVITGHTGNACTTDEDCVGEGETTCDTGVGLCNFVDTVTTSGRTGNGDINVCYATRDNTCAGANILYCRGTCVENECSNTGNPCHNDHDCEFKPNVENPNNTGVFIPVFLRTVAPPDDEECEVDSDCTNEELGIQGTCVDGDCEVLLDTSELCTPQVSTCQNEIGSLCCGLTQGAYGAPKSIATAAGECGDDNTDLGFIPAAACEGCNVFDSTCENATTIGLPGNSVTIKDLSSLVTWLPTGGTAGKLKSMSDKCYGPPFLPGDLTGGGSKGSGGGVLSGQTMACQLNAFLSDCTPSFGNGTFTASGFGDFQLPPSGVLVCTKRSGPDKILGSDDDVCQAFSYPNCVAGKSVQDVLDCANNQLANGGTQCGCTATDLVNALNNINVEFDQCGNVIECPAGQGVGQFTCPSCQAGETLCGDTCIDTNTDESHCGGCDIACAVGETCDNGVCTPPCQPDQTLCGDTCFDTNTDESHCGGCDIACAIGETCDSGVCTPPCQIGETLCGDTCFDTNTDESHCGGCDIACAIGETCDNGACTSPP